MGLNDGVARPEINKEIEEAFNGIDERVEQLDRLLQERGLAISTTPFAIAAETVKDTI